MIDYLNKFHTRLFYQILKFVHFIRVKDTQEVTALLNLSFLMLINLLSFYYFTIIYIIKYTKPVNPLYYLLAYLSILIFNYNKFMKNIDVPNKAPNHESSIVVNICTFIYLLFTFSAFIFLIRKVHAMSLINI
jgi:hypothetical protein